MLHSVSFVIRIGCTTRIIDLHTRSRYIGDKQPPRPPAPYSIFEKADLESRAVRVSLLPLNIHESGLIDSVLQEDLTKEIEELRAKSAARKAMAREKEESTDMCIDKASTITPAAVSSTFVA